LSGAVARLVGRATREVYRRELLPERVLWWLAADGMIAWHRTVERRLREHLGDRSKAVIARASARMFQRRGQVLGVAGSELALLMQALYRIERRPKARWIFSELGGAAGVTERLRAQRVLHRMSVRQRWDEVATHLGELLVVLTDDLPAELPHARKILGDICFDSGVAYGKQMQRVLAIDAVTDPPAIAMEILRTSEWIFQVNPKHWSESDGVKGALEGNACPWYSRPGWNGAHCGIFGQFQSGVSSVFGLRYQLAKTIPKHGGDTCRIEVKPITLRRSATA
jgi:hypothetical protein